MISQKRLKSIFYKKKSVYLKDNKRILTWGEMEIIFISRQQKFSLSATMWKILFSKTSQHCFPCHTLFLLPYFNISLIENWGHIYPLECKQAVTMGKGCSVTLKARFKMDIQSLVIWECLEPSHNAVRTHKPHKIILFRIWLIVPVEDVVDNQH